VAAAVRTALAGARLVHGASAVSELLTVSVGVSAVDKASSAWHPWSKDDPDRMLGHHLHAADLLHAADTALYVAKASGRDRAALLAIEHAGQPGRALVLRPIPADCSFDGPGLSCLLVSQKP
jgi:predicted signal transduction protein with EAL and GGDEF domain